MSFYSIDRDGCIFLTRFAAELGQGIIKYDYSTRGAVADFRQNLTESNKNMGGHIIALSLEGHNLAKELI